MQKISQQKLHPSNKKRDSGHDRVSESCSKKDHQKPGAYFGRRPKPAFMLLREKEISQGGGDTNKYDDSIYGCQIAHGCLHLGKDLCLHGGGDGNTCTSSNDQSNGNSRKPNVFWKKPDQHKKTQDSGYNIIKSPLFENRIYEFGHKGGV